MNYKIDSALLERLKTTLMLVAIGGVAVLYSGRIGNAVVYLVLAIAAMCIFFLTKIKDSSRHEGIGLLMGALVLIGDGYVHDLIAVPVPGAFFEKESYQSRIIVYAGRSGSVTRYRVPATIRTEHEDYEEGEDRYGQSFTRTYRSYRLEMLHMPNGGTVRFDDESIFELNDINVEITITDSTGVPWLVKTTNELSK